MRRSFPGTAIAASLALAACAPKPVAYSNPDIGMTLTYPGDWKPVDRAMMDKGAERVKGALPTEGLDEAMDHVVFGIAKIDRAGNPNLMVMKVPVSASECAEVNQSAFEAQESLEYLQSLPGAKLVPSRNVPVAGLNGYSTEFHFEDRALLQHRYWYCARGNAVLMQSTTSSAAAEEELGKVLASIRITRG
jgi:hypothetical protein